MSFVVSSTDRQTRKLTTKSNVEMLNAMNKKSLKHVANVNYILSSYNTAVSKNNLSFINDNPKATSEYIYENQKEDAMNVLSVFYGNKNRVVSIIKRTKLGMDGLMIQIGYLFGTHNDEDFAIQPANILFLTGMSNKDWETDFESKMPECFRGNVYHHGQLQQIEERMSVIRDSLIIIDEIDTGDKEDQKLHKILSRTGLLDVNNMTARNIRFIFVSATMRNELEELWKWGGMHSSYTMTIPEAYIGHKEFLELGLIQEFYEINSDVLADRWIVEDIIENYGDDYRIHIVRTDAQNVNYIEESCLRHGVLFKNHTSIDRIEDDVIQTMIQEQTKRSHIVIAVKGLYRRANLFHDAYKMKIGAIHERYTKNPNMNVQVQGLTGRMCGYHKKQMKDINHRTGPYRTSISCIREYEAFMANPTEIDIHRNTKKQKELFMAPQFITNLPSQICVTIQQTKNQNKTVPVVIQCDPNDKTDQLLFIEKSNKKYLVPLIMKKIELIKNLDADVARLYDFIHIPDCICTMTSRPGIEGINVPGSSYELHIGGASRAARNNKKWLINAKADKVNVNYWMVFVDLINHRLCFVMRYKNV